MTRVTKSRGALPTRERLAASADIISFANSIDGRFVSDIFPEQRESSFGRLLQAAVECFGKKGYHGTSTRDIARAANMSPAALYVHFRTKNELLYKITLVMAQSMLQDLANADDPNGAPADRLTALIGSYVRSIARMTMAVRVSTFEFAALNEEQQRETSRLRTKVNDKVDRVLEAGVEAGDFKIDDIRLMRIGILSMCVTVCQWYDPDGEIGPEELASDYAAIVLRMVGFIAAR